MINRKQQNWFQSRQSILNISLNVLVFTCIFCFICDPVLAGGKQSREGNIIISTGGGQSTKVKVMRIPVPFPVIKHVPYPVPVPIIQKKYIPVEKYIPVYHHSQHGESHGHHGHESQQHEQYGSPSASVNQQESANANTNSGATSLSAGSNSQLNSYDSGLYTQASASPIHHSVNPYASLLGQASYELANYPGQISQQQQQQQYQNNQHQQQHQSHYGPTAASTNQYQDVNGNVYTGAQGYSVAYGQGAESAMNFGSNPQMYAYGGQAGSYGPLDGSPFGAASSNSIQGQDPNNGYQFYPSIQFQPGMIQSPMSNFRASSFNSESSPSSSQSHSYMGRDIESLYTNQLPQTLSIRGSSSQSNSPGVIQSSRTTNQALTPVATTSSSLSTSLNGQSISAETQPPSSIGASSSSSAKNSKTHVSQTSNNHNNNNNSNNSTGSSKQSNNSNSKLSSSRGSLASSSSSHSTSTSSSNSPTYSSGLSHKNGASYHHNYNHQPASSASNEREMIAVSSTPTAYHQAPISVSNVIGQQSSPSNQASYNRQQQGAQTNNLHHHHHHNQLHQQQQQQQQQQNGISYYSTVPSSNNLNSAQIPDSLTSSLSPSSPLSTTTTLPSLSSSSLSSSTSTSSSASITNPSASTPQLFSGSLLSSGNSVGSQIIQQLRKFTNDLTNSTQTAQQQHGLGSSRLLG